MLTNKCVKSNEIHEWRDSHFSTMLLIDGKEITLCVEKNIIHLSRITITKSIIDNEMIVHIVDKLLYKATHLPLDEVDNLSIRSD